MTSEKSMSASPEADPGARVSSPPAALSASCSSLPAVDPAVVMQLEGSRLSAAGVSLPTPRGPALPSHWQRPAPPSSVKAPSATGAAPLLHPFQRHASSASATVSATGEGLPAVLTSELSSQNASVHARSAGPLSLQSSMSFQSPLVSNTHTPRAAQGFMGTGKSTLAVFRSIPATPERETTLPGKAPATHFAALTPSQEGAEAAAPATAGRAEGGDGAASGPAELPMVDPTKPTYSACDEAKRNTMEMDEAPNEGEDERKSEQSSLEFNSFAALDASFTSNTSSSGHSRGPPGGYNTIGKAAFHIFKGNVGAGVFLLPTYYQDSGYVLGVICVILLGLLMIDCALSLLHAKHTINHVEIKTYPAVVGFVLGSWFKYFTDFALIFTQFGFCVMYVQYASSTFSSLFDFPHAYETWIVITVVLVTPMTFLSNKMNLLAYASLIAGVFVGFVLAGTTAVDVQHLATSGVADGVHAFVPTARVLVFLSGHMFSLEGIGIVLPVENSLAPDQRAQFRGLLRYVLVAIVSVYICFGVLGYAAYGETLHTSVVLALPRGFMKRTLQCFLGLSLIFGYPIQYVPAIQLVDRALGVNIRRDRSKAFLVRTVLNVLFGLFAMFIGGDTINIFASFLGAFAGVHLMITIPSLLALQIDHALDPDRENKSYREYIMQIFLGPYTLSRIRRYVYLVLALIVWVGGLYYTFDSVFGSTTSSTTTDDASAARSPVTASSATVLA